jgi:LytTr DNA-binding domain
MRDLRLRGNAWCDCADYAVTQGGWTTGQRFRAAFLSPAPYVTWAALSLTLAVSGPFGTYEHCTFLRRLWCFAILVGLCLIYGIGARAALQSLLKGLGFWQASLIVIGASLFILPVPLRYLTLRLTQIPVSDSPSVLETSLIVLVFGLAAASIRWTLSRDSVLPAVNVAPDAGTHPPPGTVAEATARRMSAPPRLFARLPGDLAGRLIRLSARNHYVDVVTDRGKATLLMRLSDAIAELDGVDGLRVHRSHWVAATAVRGHERQGDKRLLILADGARVPVSRKLQRDVAARGFF